MPLFPVVFGSATTPSSSNRLRTSSAASWTMAKVTPGVGSRSIRSWSAWSGSEACDGQTWKPRQAKLTAQSTWARS